jgi:hypothetical protein
VCSFVMVARKALATGLIIGLAASLAADSVFARPAATGHRDQSGDASRLREQVAHLSLGGLIEVKLIRRVWPLSSRMGLRSSCRTARRHSDGSHFRM